jgi:hypothetical protein
VTSLLGCGFRRRAASQNDQIGQGNPLAAGLRAVEFLLNRFKLVQHQFQLRWLIGGPVLLW